MIEHNPDDLIALFHDCFFKEYNTILAYGSDEPLYLPADSQRPHHTIYFAHGFFRSALHECAHWLIAGEERRKKIDYGYWYEPDGRSPDQQKLFEKVEVKPQAMEWVLSQAALINFEVSIDNLNGFSADVEGFKSAVKKQMEDYHRYGLPSRAHVFHQALLKFYFQRG